MKRLWSVAVLIAALPLLAFGPDEQVVPTHWALIIGVSDYIHFDDVEGGDLPGAEHDARSVRDLLVLKWRVPEDMPLVMLPGRLTRWKGQTLLIEALTRLGDLNFCCVIIERPLRRTWNPFVTSETFTPCTGAPRSRWGHSPRVRSSSLRSRCLARATMAVTVAIRAQRRSKASARSTPSRS